MNAKASTPVSKPPVCRICGKVLTLPESIQKGIGPECESRYASGGDPEVVRAAHEVEKLPKGYIKKEEALKAAAAYGIPPSRFWHKACGGNRGYGQALNPSFQPVLFNGKWFLPAASISQKNLELVSSMERKVAPKAPKAAKVAKAPVGKKAPAKQAPVKQAPPSKKAVAKAPAPKAPAKAPAKVASKPVQKAPAKPSPKAPAPKPAVVKKTVQKGSGEDKPETVIIGGVPVSKDTRNKIAAGLKKIQAEKASSDE